MEQKKWVFYLEYARYPGIVPGRLLLLASSCISLCSCYYYDYCFLLPVAPQGALPAPGVRLSPFIAMLIRRFSGRTDACGIFGKGKGIIVLELVI